MFPASDIKIHDLYSTHLTSLAAAFALDVYRDPGRPALPENWYLLSDCPKEYQKKGYFGAAYYQLVNEKQMLVMIAHRGTANVQGIYEDLRYLLLEKSPPPQFYQAVLPFIDAIRQQLKAEYADKEITLIFTGHSLGATLAEISLAYAQTHYGLADDQYDKAGNIAGELYWQAAYTFESPGSAPMLDNMLEKNEISAAVRAQISTNLIVHNTDVDAINTCMLQTQVRAIQVGYDWVASREDSYPLTPTALYFLLNFTVKDQHGMKKIYDFFMQTPSDIMPTQTQWPKNPWAGYQCYQTYEGQGLTSFHTLYWDGFNTGLDEARGYIQRVWDSHLELHEQYDNDYSNFYAAYKNALQEHSSLRQKEETLNDKVNDFRQQALIEHERAKQWLQLHQAGKQSLLKKILLNDLLKLEKQAKEYIKGSDFAEAAKQVAEELKNDQNEGRFLPALFRLMADKTKQQY